MTHPPTPEAGVPTCYRHPGRESHIRCQRCSRPICPDCMRDASVGFQCPECVAEGARTTRQGRTAYGGRLAHRGGTVSLTLIGLNLAVFVAVLATGYKDSRLLDYLMLRPRGLCWVDGNGGYAVARDSCTGVGEWLPGVADGAYWQIITSAFTHVEILHLGLNMLAIYVLAPQLEMLLGRARFLAVYLLSALAGSAAVLWLGGEYQAVLGASGAVWGLMAALLVVARRSAGDVSQLMLWIGLNVLLTFTVSQISWQGHLGGFVGGLLVTLAVVLAPRGPRRTTYQVAGIVAVAALIAVAIVSRVVVLA